MICKGLIIFNITYNKHKLNISHMYKVNITLKQGVYFAQVGQIFTVSYLKYKNIKFIIKIRIK